MSRRDVIGERELIRRISEILVEWRAMTAL